MFKGSRAPNRLTEYLFLHVVVDVVPVDCGRGGVVVHGGGGRV